MVDQGFLTQAKQLTPADRMELIGELWASLNPDDFPVTDAERSMLDERLADLAKDPDASRQWEKVDADLSPRLP